jgi:Raf kinase inhibitor-like YbhB/YbcL family protein
MRSFRMLLACAAAAGLAGATETLAGPPQQAGAGTMAHQSDSPSAEKEPLVLERLGVSKTLTVKSTAFAEGSAIPRKYAAAGEDVSPALSWEAGPSGTKAYAVLVEDPDAHGSRPFVHWAAWNIGKTSLAEAVPPQAPDLVQGENGRGKTGYFGPKPPPGRPHHYYFEVFALDAPLGLKPGADRAALESAMKGHVLAGGKLMGTYQSGEEN